MTTDLNKLLLANELRMAIADAPKSLRDYVEELEPQRDELVFQMRYILEQTRLEHIHDTASAALAKVIQ